MDRIVLAHLHALLYAVEGVDHAQHLGLARRGVFAEAVPFAEAPGGLDGDGAHVHQLLDVGGDILDQIVLETAVSGAVDHGLAGAGPRVTGAERGERTRGGLALRALLDDGQQGGDLFVAAQVAQPLDGGVEDLRIVVCAEFDQRRNRHRHAAAHRHVDAGKPRRGIAVGHHAQHGVVSRLACEAHDLVLGGFGDRAVSMLGQRQQRRQGGWVIEGGQGGRRGQAVRR